MNDRRARFIAEYAVDGNAAAAARRAGYSARSARVNGPRMLRNAAVREALQASQAETARKLEMDRATVLAGLLEAVEMARTQADVGALIRAWAEIGKMLGFYAPERVLKVDVNVAMKRMIGELETRSDAELLAIVADAAAQ